MKEFGLIGKPLTHSFSKKLFTEKFEQEQIQATYELFELNSIKEFPELIETHPNLVGLNVTIPFKQEVISYLDEIETSARMVGAVNTIKIVNNKSQKILRGYNTDVDGFNAILCDIFDQKEKPQALILGTGGASRAVQYVLRKNGIGFLLVSRSSSKHGQINYHMLTKSIFNKFKLIINTTPLGMSPLVEEMPPIPYQFITNSHVLIDLIYNPAETKFLAMGKAVGAQVCNGIQMFEQQAKEAWEIWSNHKK